MTCPRLIDIDIVRSDHMIQQQRSANVHMIILTPGVDGLQHAVEHDRVQQREGHPGAARQALET